MAHVLMIEYPASGHINPNLPVMAELVRRGHRLTVVVPEHYRDQVEATGARVLPYPSMVPPGWAGVRIPRHPDSGQMARGRLNMIRETLTPLPSVVVDLGSTRPDVVVYDEFGSAAGRVLSLAWRLPSVVTCPTFAASETFSPYAEAVLEGDMEAPDPRHPAMREAASVVRSSLDIWGLTAVSVADFLAGADERCHLVFLPRAFQPGGESFDERFHFVGPCLRSGADETGWSPPESGRPVVLISLGTQGYDNSAAVLRRAVAAVRRIGAHAVVSLGDVDPALVGEVDEHVELHRGVAQLAVLRHASAFISHAGMNSTMEALSYGVPLVDLAQTGEQRLVAARVAELDLGRALDPDEVDEHQLADALREVCTAPEVARAVAEMRAVIASSGGVAEAADVVESRMSRPATPE